MSACVAGPRKMIGGQRRRLEMILERWARDRWRKASQAAKGFALDPKSSWEPDGTTDMVRTWSPLPRCHQPGGGERCLRN